MAVNFWIEYRNSQKVLLPVNPQEITITRGGRNSTEEIVETGEINILKTPSLKEIEFESFIPTANAGGYVEQNATVYAPKFYRDFFEAVQSRKEPIRLIITGLDINLQMSVETFDYRWEGSDSDMYYTLTLKEYKAFKAKVAIIKTATPSSSSANSKRENTSKKLAVGAKVRVNGTLRKDSYGSSPGVTEKNAIRKISIIVSDSSRPFPIHVTTLEGGWRGWVRRNEVEVI